MEVTTLRLRAHHLLHNPTGNNAAAAWLNRAIVVLIIANAIAVALETVPNFYLGNEHIFKTFETVSLALFLAEYLTRLWCAVEQEKFAHPITGRLRWMTKPIAFLDLIAIITFFAPADLRFLRLARLLRLFRVLNLEAMANSFDHLKACIAARKNLLLVSAVLMCIALF